MRRFKDAKEWSKTFKSDYVIAVAKALDTLHEFVGWHKHNYYLAPMRAGDLQKLTYLVEEVIILVEEVIRHLQPKKINM